MTREEFSKVIAVIKGVYADPKFVADTVAMETWYIFFKDYDFETIMDAASNYIRHDDFGKAPVPGQIIASINTGREYLPEEDAWNLVYKGICNSNYHALEEFNKLPPECQKAIGSATIMREISMTSFNEMNVSKSYFLKAYKAEVEKRKNFDKTPEGLKAIKAECAAQIEADKEGKLLIEEVKE